MAEQQENPFDELFGRLSDHIDEALKRVVDGNKGDTSSGKDGGDETESFEKEVSAFESAAEEESQESSEPDMHDPGIPEEGSTRSIPDGDYSPSTGDGSPRSLLDDIGDVPTLGEINETPEKEIRQDQPRQPGDDFEKEFEYNRPAELFEQDIEDSRPSPRTTSTQQAPQDDQRQVDVNQTITVVVSMQDDVARQIAEQVSAVIQEQYNDLRAQVQEAIGQAVDLTEQSRGLL